MNEAQDDLAAPDDPRSLLHNAYLAALAAVAPQPCTFKQLGWLGNDSLRIGSVLLPRPRAVHLVSVGKAATAMARGAHEALEGQLASITVITNEVLVPPSTPSASPSPLPSTAVHLFAEHPLPGPGSLRAGEHVARLASALKADELLLACVSGGGSSMMCTPRKTQGVPLPLAGIAEMARLAMRAGIAISELNPLRAAVDELKFGGLAHLASPADCGALIVSDVPGDDLDLVASGPTRRRAIEAQKLVELCQRSGFWEQLHPQIRAALQVDRPALPRARRAPFDVLVASNADARRAAGEYLGKAGFESISLGASLQGGAGEAALVFAAACDAPATRALGSAKRCVVAGGETTVELQGEGRGGRTMEFAYALVNTLAGRPGVTVMCVSTDGLDGNSGAAGVFVDGSSLERARVAGVDLARAASDNDLATAFAAMGDLVHTGATGTNVCDLAFWLETD